MTQQATNGSVTFHHAVDRDCGGIMGVPGRQADRTRHESQSTSIQRCLVLRFRGLGNASRREPTTSRQCVCNAMTDASDLSAAVHNIGRPIAGLPMADDGIQPKSAEWLCDSSFCAVARTKILPRFVNQPVETTCRDIGFKLPVPLPGVKFSKPRAKRRSFLGGQLSNCFFDLLNLCHDSRISPLRATGNPEFVTAAFAAAALKTPVVSLRWGIAMAWPSSRLRSCHATLPRWSVFDRDQYLCRPVCQD